LTNTGLRVLDDAGGEFGEAIREVLGVDVERLELADQFASLGLLLDPLLDALVVSA